MASYFHLGPILSDDLPRPDGTAYVPRAEAAALPGYIVVTSAREPSSKRSPSKSSGRKTPRAEAARRGTSPSARTKLQSKRPGPPKPAANAATTARELAAKVRKLKRRIDAAEASCGHHESAAILATRPDIGEHLTGLLAGKSAAHVQAVLAAIPLP